jgi:hypothetical protein
MLDIMLLPPVEPKSKKKAVPSRRSRRVLSESATSESSDYPVLLSPTILGESDGLEPPANQRMEIEEWERKTGRVLTGDDSDEVAGLVTWCFVRGLHAVRLEADRVCRSSGMISSTTNVSAPVDVRAPTC